MGAHPVPFVRIDGVKILHWLLQCLFRNDSRTLIINSSSFGDNYQSQNFPTSYAFEACMMHQQAVNLTSLVKLSRLRDLKLQTRSKHRILLATICTNHCTIICESCETGIRTCFPNEAEKRASKHIMTYATTPSIAYRTVSGLPRIVCPCRRTATGCRCHTRPELRGPADRRSRCRSRRGTLA